MLHYAGFTKRLGDVDHGDTVMDYMKQERERGITITSAAITFGWNNHQINLIDTPGHVDFTIEVERSVRVLDGAVTILDAVSGVEAQTQTVWAQADKYGIPRIAYINKMDRIGAEFGKTIREIRYKLGVIPLICQIPIMKKDSKGDIIFSEIIDILDMQVLDWNKDPKGSIVNKILLTKDNPLFKEAVRGRTHLIEILSEMDDQLLEIFLANEDPMKVPVKDIKDTLRRITLNGKAIPIFCGASFKNIGVQPLMDAIIDYLPSPLDCPTPLATLSNNQMIEISLKENEKLCALAFKVIHNPKRGFMVFVRVYSGKINNRMTLYNTNTRQKERVNKLLQMYANDVEEIPSIKAGNIGVIIGLKETRTGDTLIQMNDSRQDLQLQNIDIPAPVFFCAVEPASTSDEKPLEEALKHILREDPSFHVHVDSDSGQTLISGMGELHLEIIKDRLLTDFKVNVVMGKMRISYRETITNQSEYTHLYDRELMGKKQKIQVSLKIIPLSENDKGVLEQGGNRIELDVTSNILIDTMQPQNSLITKLDKEEIEKALYSGILSALNKGPILGFMITGLYIKVHSLKLFGLESTKTAISTCVVQAFDKAMKHGTPALLEPLMDVEVEIPEEYLGDILSDLTGTRRGIISGLEVSRHSIDYDDSIDIYIPSSDLIYTTSNKQQQVIIKPRRIIKALVPLSTLLGYSSSLRSLTGGTGSFSMRVHSFGIMSEDRTKAVIHEMQGGY
ncbi:14293_t:CDS:2 [Funneliformis caledonium]|uniref:Elongation factor 2 n=1 Tax=Funneliformis caledonium TaxID=1117310 RepID=A0A9N8Z2K6_9GLOM|nr:14293_t:CDS:2 [Funneliformis caledonium]